MYQTKPKINEPFAVVDLNEKNRVFFYGEGVGPNELYKIAWGIAGKLKVQTEEVAKDKAGDKKFMELLGKFQLLTIVVEKTLYSYAGILGESRGDRSLAEKEESVELLKDGVIVSNNYLIARPYKGGCRIHSNISVEDLINACQIALEALNDFSQDNTQEPRTVTRWMDKNC